MSNIETTNETTNSEFIGGDLKVPNNVSVGEKYKTIGGWKTKVIHISHSRDFLWAIHQPGTPLESVPIMHRFDGRPMSAFSIAEPPVYDSDHPSCIIFNEDE